MQLFRSRPRRLIAFAAGAAVAVGLFVAPQTVLAAPTPPPNPTDGQISSEQAAKNALANEVGQLSADIAAKQQQVQQSQAQVELAEQKVALRVSQYRDSVTARDRAIAAAAQARKDLGTATQKVADSQRRFAQYMQASYIDGQPSGLTGTLLTARDPNALLQQSSYQQFEASQNVGVIGDMQRVTVGRSNAAAKARNLEAKARTAVRFTAKRKADSIAAQQDAVATFQRHQQEQTEYEQTRVGKQAELDQKRARLATLNGQRATYLAYQREQARIAEQRRQRIAAEKARQAEIDRQKREAAQRQREQNQNNGGGNSGGGGGSTYNPPPKYNPPAPGNGSWTAAKAQRAVNRAESTLGTPYAWAGGGAGGPSYGACVPSAGAPYDCNIRGYDCSGLVMYAWGKGWDHYAATQYNQAGSVHPSRSNLRKGDLLFYSSNGSVGGIHHVAMYVGGGRIIEAPYSGGYVQYNSLYAYSDFYGATRPLT